MELNKKKLGAILPIEGYYYVFDSLVDRPLPETDTQMKPEQVFLFLKNMMKKQIMGILIAFMAIVF